MAGGSMDAVARRKIVDMRAKPFILEMLRNLQKGAAGVPVFPRSTPALGR
jgi:hypothetical protein